MSMEFWHDWQFFRVNWIEFTFVKLYAERDGITGVSEIVVGLLGLNLRLHWTHDPAKLAEMREHVKALTAHPEGQ